MEPCDLSAVAARALIGRRALSPVELTASCIARIEAVDHAVNAVVARDFDRACAAAREAEAAVMRGDALGALHGLPLGVKDLADTAGLRTTYGSLLYRDHVPLADSHHVAAVRKAGAIVLGKTNTPEFGAGANTRNRVYGATGNPFDPTLSAAGSSGGSAVALATGMVPLATGSDMGGSLRNPASFCGIVGFRPSPGLVADDAGQLGWSPLAVAGPMARDVADCALMLGAMAGAHPSDPLSGAVFAARPAADLACLRMAFSEDLGFAPVEHVVRATFRDAAARLGPAFAVAEEAAPDCTGTDTAFAVLRGLHFLAAQRERVARHPTLIGPNVARNVAEAERFTMQDAAQAMVEQTRLARAWAGFFRRWDILVTPAISIVPRPWSELAPTQIDRVALRAYYSWLALAYAASLVGHPAICIPCGTGPTGMPFGLQIVGARGADAQVIAAALALEPLCARPVPDIVALQARGPISAMPGFAEMPT